jgi:hypothetical protein
MTAVYFATNRAGDATAPFDKDSFLHDLARYHDLLGGIPFGFVAWPNIILTWVRTVLMGYLAA